MPVRARRSGSRTGPRKGNLGRPICYDVNFLPFIFMWRHATVDMKMSRYEVGQPMPTSKPKDSTITTKPRSDGRRSLLIYKNPELIKSVKKVALDDERPLYEIVEEATREWMGQRSSAGGKSALERASRGKKK
jgi:hypothetical protein